MSASNSRAIAANILAELVVGKGSLTTHLSNYKHLDDYALLQETCFGSCRWFHLLEIILDTLLSKALKKKETDLKCLLLVGLYQLRELSVPDYAVINEAVAATRSLGKPWAKALVNAVLRNYLRRRDETRKALTGSDKMALLSHPDWLAKATSEQWPEQALQILANNNLRPPMTLRVNLAKTSRDEMLRRLAAAKIQATAGILAETAIYLAVPMSVGALPGFQEGWLSVQDEASQLVPDLLHLAPGMRVLDACAAPGGKTCHILESEPLLASCVALDKSAQRTERIEENLLRLGLAADLHVADATQIEDWWNQQQFDRILLDAPCSATGVIRRHPDIKLLRSEQDIASLVRSQQQLLRALWPTLKPGGLFLYTTCSILRQENEDSVAEFLRSVDNAKYQGITADWGVECSLGRQLLPGKNNGPDGFFYCVLEKVC